MRKLLRKQGFAPRLIVTEKLRSYGAAFHDRHLTCRMSRAQDEQSRGEFASNRATTRAQDAALQVSRICPAFLSMHAAVHNDFDLQRHLTLSSAVH